LRAGDCYDVTREQVIVIMSLGSRWLLWCHLGLGDCYDVTREQVIVASLGSRWLL